MAETKKQFSKRDDITRQLSSKWQSMSHEERVPYFAMAAKDKERYEQQKAEAKGKLNARLQSDDFEYIRNNEELFGKRTCGVVCDLSD